MKYIPVNRNKFVRFVKGYPKKLYEKIGRIKGKPAIFYHTGTWLKSVVAVCHLNYPKPDEYLIQNVTCAQEV